MTQEPTTENENVSTSRTLQADRRSLSRDMRTADDPHYVVITGTNIRSTLPGKDFTPKVYDSEAIASAAIDAEIANRKAKGIRATTPKSPISITYYNRKYSAYVYTPKERIYYADIAREADRGKVRNSVHNTCHHDDHICNRLLFRYGNT